MKRYLAVLMAAALAAASQAAVLVYEGFGDAAADVTLVGYSGSSAELGLSGTWAVPGNADRQDTKARTNYEYVGISGGYTPDTVGDRQHWWEHNNAWNLNRAQRSLAGSIDMTVDGTWYMSFLSMSAKTDYVAQIGLNDGTNEVMFGNGYSGASNKGLTAYYGVIGTDPTTNGNGTFVAGYGLFPQETGFYVAKLVKSNSGTTNNLDVSIKFYDFGTPGNPTNTIDIADPAAWTRVVSLTGVSNIFTNFELKLDGGGENWPSIDEVRIGQSWMDVTVGNVGLIAPANGVEYVAIDTNLEWSVGNGWAVDVYLSQAYNEPNGAPALSLVDTENTSELYNIPSDLEYAKWYYWRVDELEPNTVGYIVHPGIVWSFKTVGQDPLVNPVTPSAVTVEGNGTESAVFLTTGVNISGYQWYKIGDPSDEPLAEGAKYAGVETNTLTINNVGLADEGYYYCVVSNTVSQNTDSNRDTGPGLLLTKRLVGWWKLDGNLLDSVQEEVPGAPVHDGICDDPNYVAVGKDGGALEFFGDIEGIVKIADSNDFFNFYQQGYTVSAWVNLPVHAGNWSAYVAKQGQDPQRGFILTMDGSGQAVHTLRQSFNDLFANTEVDDDNWHLVIGTYDAVSKEGKVYVDGLVKNQAINSGIPQASPAPLIFGAEQLNGESAYTGRLDDVRIWSYVLDSVAVAQLYVGFNPGSEVCVANPEYDVAGPDGIGNEFRDCRVNLYDFVPFAQAWLNCNIVPTCIP